MTTIAWDGRTLAADKQSTDSSGLMTTVTKIWRIDDYLFGATGSSPAIQEFKHWISNGADPKDFPSNIRPDTPWSVHAIVISAEQGIRVFENSAFAFTVERTRHAMGSGRDFALGAMRCGKSAVQAVEIASEFDCGTGQGVDTLTLA